MIYTNNAECGEIFSLQSLFQPYRSKKLVGNGANINNLNQKVLNEFVVSYPPLPEQQAIVKNLKTLKSKVDRLQENYNKISQECDALKQAILRQVFE